MSSSNNRFCLWGLFNKFTHLLLQHLVIKTFYVLRVHIHYVQFILLNVFDVTISIMVRKKERKKLYYLLLNLSHEFLLNVFLIILACERNRRKKLAAGNGAMVCLHDT